MRTAWFADLVFSDLLLMMLTYDKARPKRDRIDPKKKEQHDTSLEKP